MADMRAQLSSELERIIKSSYPPSLSHLADLLARADALTIRACVHDRSSCGVSRLAAIVCEALPLWAYTLRVLWGLSQSPRFVDTLLRQNPGLLNTLIAKANSSPREYDEYAGLCILLLSRPLPTSVPLPASAQSFFLRVFDIAKQNPNVVTLKPVYSMLNGACRNLLGMLPAERREHFDQVMSHLLSSNGTGQNYMLKLWCFGIVLLMEHSDETDFQQSTQPTNDESPARLKRQWKTASGHKIFGSIEKIYKMISLAYLSVIFATKGDVGVSDDEAIEGVQIAICTLQCVDRTALRAWPKSSVLAQGTFPKLPVKILRANINPAVQLEALCFYSMIVGEGSLPLEIVAQYERCLVDVADLAYPDCLGETFLISLPIYAPQMQQHIVQELLVKILDACTSPVDSHQLSIYTSLVEHITTSLPSCESLRSVLLHAVSSSELQGKIWGVVRYKAQKKDSTCRAYTALLHQSLNTAVIAMLLTLVLTAQPIGHDLPPALTTALVSKQRQLGHGVSKCSHEIAIEDSTPVSLFQQKNTPYTGQHLHDWRDRLKSELESQGSYQRDSIVRSVAQICQDLETRCNTVEEPLRREKERTQELEQHILKLDERIASLEVQAADDRFHSEGLEDEKMIISEERNSLSAKLEHLQATSDEAIRKTTDMLGQAREDYNIKELELRSMILTHEETIRALENDIEAQSNAVGGLRHDLADAQDECALRGQQLETVQHRFDDAERKLNDELQIVRMQSEEIMQLKNQKSELASQLQGTKTNFDAITVQLSDLLSSHQELGESSREANKALNDKYTRDMEAAAAQAKDDRESLGAKLREAIQDGQRTAEAYDKTRKEHTDLQESVAILEERIQELTIFCSEQEEELEELRTLRKNVLASMGLASQNPLEMRSASRTQKDITDPQKTRAAREHRRRKSAIHVTDGVGCRVAQDADSTAMENVANASFASSDSHSSQHGTTPKRSKVQSTFKVPTMHTPYASRSITRKLSPIKRSALRQLSPNRRHTTADLLTLGSGEQLDRMHSARKRRNSLHGIAEADFDMEDFLTSTSLTPARFASGTGRIPDDDSVTATEL